MNINKKTAILAGCATAAATGLAIYGAVKIFEDKYDVDPSKVKYPEVLSFTPLDRRIHELAEQYEKDAAQLLIELIRFPEDHLQEDPLCGTSNHEKLRLDFLQQRIIDLGAVTSKSDVSFDDFGNLVWHVSDPQDPVPLNDRKVIYLDARSDTLPVNNELWQMKLGNGLDAYQGLVDPQTVKADGLRAELTYAPTKDRWRNLIFGSGAADQLQGIVSAVFATKILLETMDLNSLRGCVVIAIASVSGAENAGGAISNRFRRQKLANWQIPDSVILLQSTGDIQNGPCGIYIGQQGRCQIEVEIAGFDYNVVHHCTSPKLNLFQKTKSFFSKQALTPPSSPSKNNTNDTNTNNNNTNTNANINDDASNNANNNDNDDQSSTLNNNNVSFSSRQSKMSVVEHGSFIIAEAESQAKKTIKGCKFMGKGSRKVLSTKTEISHDPLTPSRFTFRFERLTTQGETWIQCINEIEKLKSVKRARSDNMQIRITIPRYSDQSWRGVLADNDIDFPSWLTPPDSDAVKLAVEAYKRVVSPHAEDAPRFPIEDVQKVPRISRWACPSDGVGYLVPEDQHRLKSYGKDWIRRGNFVFPPIFGIGAGYEQHAGKMGEYVPKDQLWVPVSVAARFPSLFAQRGKLKLDE